MKSFIFMIGCFCFPFFAQAKQEDPRLCSPSGDAAETRPAPVNLLSIQKELLGFRDAEGRRLFETLAPSFIQALQGLFEVDPSKISKLEQFYGILFYMAKYKTLKDRELSFNREDVVKMLLASRVFSTPEIPERVKSVSLVWDPHRERAHYDVRFDRAEVRLPLNQGKGFSSFKEGMCQTAKELIFYGGFQFDVYLTVNHNHVMAGPFKNVDLYGRFGARGIVDVDLNYVSLRSVEFLSGSPMGVVKAKVSKREFEVNDHSFLLRLVSSLVTDKSTQAIDW